jgi:acetyltransferase
VDVLGDADAARYGHAVEAAAADPNSDGTPFDPHAPRHDGRHRVGPTVGLKAKALGEKPILASWMGGDTVEAGRTILHDAGVPVFNYPDTAAKIFCTMHAYNRNLQSLYETPRPAVGLHELGVDLEKRGPTDSKRSVRRADGVDRRRIQTSCWLCTASPLWKPAWRSPRRRKPPGKPTRWGSRSSLKLHSKTITHKSDVGGVILNLGGRGGGAAGV